MDTDVMKSEAKAFGAHYDYDVSYLYDLIDLSPDAAAALNGFKEFYKYRGPAGGQAVWTGALLASTLEGDCGPCAQLVISMAMESGGDPDQIRACVEGRATEAGKTGLGFRFAEMAIKGDAQADRLRAEIQSAYGSKAAVSCAFAAASGRVYPVIKRGIGHGAPCEELGIAGETVKVHR